jgi:hypothetical protein
VARRAGRNMVKSPKDGRLGVPTLVTGVSRRGPDKNSNENRGRDPAAGMG